MKIKQIKHQNRRDFTAIYECERGVIKLVVCSKTQDGCEGCGHAEEHEPYTMKNGNKCGMDGFCDIHCTDVVCKEVL